MRFRFSPPRSRTSAIGVFAPLVLWLVLWLVPLAPAHGAEPNDERDLAGIITLARRGDPAAIEALEDASSRPDTALIRDAVLFSLAAARTSKTPAGAAAVLRRLLESTPESPLAARAIAELARLDRDAVDITELRSALKSQMSTDARRADVAALALELGRREIETDAGAASRTLIQARELGRGDATARDAAKLLSILRASRPELEPKDAESLYLEALLCGAEGDTDGQLRRIDLLLANYPSTHRARTATLQRARLLSGTQGRESAAAWLEARARAAGSESFRATLLHAAANYRWNADQDERAMAGFRAVVDLDASAALTQESRYAIGRIHESRQRYDAAALEYEKAASGPGEKLAAESRWRIGWTAYLGQDFVGSRSAFARMAERYNGDNPPGAREAALYWEARSAEKVAGREAAIALYQRVIKEYPDGYYAYLVELRTELRADGLRPQAISPGSPIDSQTVTRLERARRLYAIGFGDIADIEVARLVDAANADRQKHLLPHLTAAGAHRTALVRGLALYHRGNLSEDQLYPFLYPRAFADAVTAASKSKQIDPLLVYALIKQESLFDRQATSPASAFGLMQLLLSTARRMGASEPGRTIEREDLYDPFTNIALGTAYLAELAKRYDRNVILMLAGYNAGEKAADGWRDRFSGLDTDEFVERITYRETRDYVKKVVSNVRNYSRLYTAAGSDPLS